MERRGDVGMGTEAGEGDEESREGMGVGGRAKWMPSKRERDCRKRAMKLRRKTLEMPAEEKTGRVGIKGEMD